MMRNCKHCDFIVKLILSNGSSGSLMTWEDLFGMENERNDESIAKGCGIVMI